MSASQEAAAEWAAEPDKAHETLSQLLARILDQLSLSAWLPAGALVLLSTYVLELGSVLHAPGVRPSIIDATGGAAGRIGRISLGGGLLLAAAVVVLTMVTQAFSFEAIRTFEGYWGPSRLAEWLADRRAARHRRTLARIEKQIVSLALTAWSRIEQGLAAQRKESLRRGDRIDLTEDLILVLEAQFNGRLSHRMLTDDEQTILDDFMDSGEWQHFVDPSTLRRMSNVAKSRQDYPSEKSVLPTRLGNVLRHYEDETRIATIEPFVEDHFDELPASLRTSHDERRTRLDLYCAMVVVVAVDTALAVGVLWLDFYPFVALGVGLAIMWLNYRAAIVSARAYGSTLLSIVKWISDHPPADTTVTFS